MQGELQFLVDKDRKKLATWKRRYLSLVSQALML